MELISFVYIYLIFLKNFDASHKKNTFFVNPSHLI